MISKGLQSLPIEKVNLDKGNPRIKHFIEIFGEKITSKQIALALSYTSDEGSTSYQALRESIKVSGGIIHPIVVCEDSEKVYTVIEGNTRLQIYKEFKEDKVEGSWDYIPCLVYQQMTEIEKHEIRLQSHLVGPRSWDAYSKAKYLYQLSEQELLPLETVISMCGGKKKDVMEAIEAYKCMHKHYEEYMKKNGQNPDYNEFSKFNEYQKSKPTKNAVYARGYTDEDFAKWVASGKINTAQSVRSLAAIFKNDEALSIFMKYDIAEASKIIAAENISTDVDWDKIPYEMLCRKLCDYLDRIELKEIKKLAIDPSFDGKKVALLTLLNDLQEVVEEIQAREN